MRRERASEQWGWRLRGESDARGAQWVLKKVGCKWAARTSGGGKQTKASGKRTTVWERGGERERRNESFMFAHISRNILCLSLLPLVYPVSVRPARPCVSVLLFSFLLFPPARSLRALSPSLSSSSSPPSFSSRQRCTHSLIRASLSRLTSPPIYSTRCLRSR